MSNAPQLKLDRFQVAFGDEDDPGSWITTEVVTRPRDTMAASDLFGRHKDWGKPADNQHKLALATVYYALRRRGDYSGNFDQFTNELLDLEKMEDDSDDVDPTGTAMDD